MIIYKDNFNSKYNIDSNYSIQGKVHDDGVLNNLMVLSYKSLKNGFEYSKDGQNVGVHEFSHLLVLDKSDGAFDGIPIGLPKDLHKVWLELFEKEIKKIKRNKSKLDKYGASSKVEFFAVIMEEYRENPKRFKKNQPELYKIIEQWTSVNN